MRVLGCACAQRFPLHTHAHSADPNHLPHAHRFFGAGAFITMNPGYLGRSELPEGLKVLFRPITVMVPDLVLICENMLMAEGFVEAKVLASKFYSLYALLRELLSKQVRLRRRGAPGRVAPFAPEAR